MFYFVVNKFGGSGKTKKNWTRIEKLIKKTNIECKIIETKENQSVSDISRDILKNNDDDKKIVVVGGDGTLNSIINGIDDFSKVKLGLIPSGSGNDFARGLNIPRHFYNIKKNFYNIIESKHVRLIDLGRMVSHNINRLFCISSGIGMDALVCKKTIDSKIKSFLNKIHLGSLAYVILTVISLFSMDTSSASIQIDDEKMFNVDKMIFFAGMNLSCEGGGVKMAPDALYDDGKLVSCMVHGIPKILTFFLLPILVMGKQKIIKKFYVRKFSKLIVKSEKKLSLHTDGEYLGEFDYFEMEVLPKKLQLLN